MKSNEITYKFQQGLFDDSWNIRKIVFMDEQKFHDELEEKDKECYHLVMYINGIPVGNSRIEVLDNKACHLGRIAIIKEYRGKNLGNILLNKTEEVATERFDSNVFYLDAQEDKVGFYIKNGYKKTDDPVFLEEYCPHVKMWKKL